MDRVPDDVRNSIITKTLYGKDQQWAPHEAVNESGTVPAQEPVQPQPNTTPKSRTTPQQSLKDILEDTLEGQAQREQERLGEKVKERQAIIEKTGGTGLVKDMMGMFFKK
jgi:hypothetical protein